MITPSQAQRPKPMLISIRNMDAASIARLQAVCRVRGWSYGKAISQLLLLHERVRARADAGDDALQAELVALGLQSVHEGATGVQR